MTPATAPPPDVAPAPAAEPDSLYEVVNGRIVEPPPMGTYEAHLATLLSADLVHFARNHNLGRAETETLFLIDPTTGLRRRPDVAFVSYERWPRDRRIPRTPAWDVVPDLAIEVVSPTNRAGDVLDKMHEYFRAGVRLVWVVFPDQAEVYAYESPTLVHILSRADALEGGPVLPDFRLPLAELFEEDEPATTTAPAPG